MSSPSLTRSRRDSGIIIKERPHGVLSIHMPNQKSNVSAAFQPPLPSDSSTKALGLCWKDVMDVKQRNINVAEWDFTDSLTIYVGHGSKPFHVNRLAVLRLTDYYQSIIMKDPKCRHAIAVSIEPSIMNMFLRLAYDPHTPLGLDVSQMDFLRAAVAAYNLGLETRPTAFSNIMMNAIFLRYHNATPSFADVQLVYSLTNPDSLLRKAVMDLFVSKNGFDGRKAKQYVDAGYRILLDLLSTLGEQQKKKNIANMSKEQKCEPYHLHGVAIYRGREAQRKPCYHGERGWSPTGNLGMETAPVLAALKSHDSGISNSIVKSDWNKELESRMSARHRWTESEHARRTVVSNKVEEEADADSDSGFDSAGVSLFT